MVIHFQVLYLYIYLFFFFFFQAEDGIRDSSVTGVQTCALPISTTAPFWSRTTPCKSAAFDWACDMDALKHVNITKQTNRTCINVLRHVLRDKTIFVSPFK